MEGKSDLYTEVFIDSNLGRHEMGESIAQILKAHTLTVLDDIVTNTSKMYLDDNEFFKIPSTERSSNPDELFIFYRYILEMEPNENISHEKYIDEVSYLLQELWKRGYKAVANCSFEAELPDGGGTSFLQ